MKIKNLIFKILSFTLMIGFIFQTTALATMTDYTTDKAKSLKLSYFRYAQGGYKNGYALNTTGNEGESHHPVFQIMNGNNTNYYCLNATAGESWLSGTVGATATYNRSYDLTTDTEQLKNDTNAIYNKIGNSSYLKQILWILDNIYIPNASLENSANLSKKQELLAKAGIVFGKTGEVDLNDNPLDNDTYKYVAQTGYDYNAKLNTLYNDSVKINGGWFYKDTNSEHKYIELSDELVEVAQQAALWYYTNYKDNNSANSNTYNVKEQGLQLVCSNGTTNTNSLTWKSLENEIFNVDTDVTDYKAPVGKWEQEQATILCWYLIDAADNYANAVDNTSGNPLKINSTTNIGEKKVENKDYYVVGPIKIEKQREAVYSIGNTITVNGDANTGAYISNAEGARQSNQNVSNYIESDFYVAIPKSKINSNTVKIEFDGTYKTNSKTLWVSTTATEQPVVEVEPKDEPINLPITVEIEEQKEFDLALRKVITKLTDKEGTVKLISNEEGKLATRNVTTVASDIESNGTATYKHRKDPVVVEKGDIITYSITVYNEGEMPGYAETIVDRLPTGIVPKAYAENKTTSGSLEGMTVVPVPQGQLGGIMSAEYTYTYDKDKNEITLTNKGKYALPEYGEVTKEAIAQETVNIECVVTGEPSTTNNKYLTNIAYISKAYNTETKQEVVQDRDSRTDNNPNATLNTEGSKYTGYHGGNNHNGDNNKDVYKDGTNNDDYFQGREDDDDFEVAVIKPVEFDMALQKYISGILSSDGTATAPGRNKPTINTKNLAEKTATTATYTQDKTPISVQNGQYVIYTFTVYNEGEVDGYVKKITDNIPKGLEFVYAKDNDGKTIIVCDSEGNMTEMEVTQSVYKNITDNNSFWTIDANGNTLKKDAYNGENTISVTCDVENAIPAMSGGLGQPVGGGYLKAYDKSKDINNNGDGLDRLSVTLMLRVNTDVSGKAIRNEAAITEATDKDGNIQDASGSDLKDRDSKTTEWKGKDGDKNYEDDEDYDRIVLPKVDLALTKFITAVSEDIKIEDGEYLTQDKTSKNAGTTSNPYTRATKVDTVKLRDDETCHDATYTMVKDPLTLHEGDYVLYNIRVYNEGEVDVYAGEVTDYLPNYLDFVDCDYNTEYKWKVESDGKTIKTSYLSSTNGTDKKLKAFDKVKDDGKGSGLDYKDLSILCRVNSNAPDKTRLVNTAAITKYEDKDGNKIDKDEDSEPNEIPDEDKNKEKRTQDDDDYEVVEVKKRKVDLALTKFITAISEDIKIEDGEYLTQDKTSKNAGTTSNPYTRATKVDTVKLRDDETCHDATYTMVKDPLTVPAKSYVLYNIRVYNEGETDTFAGEITDKLPDYLDFVECDFNAKWKVESDGKTIKTTYLSKANGETNKLKAFDRAKDDGKGSGLDYRDVAVLCKVNDNAPSNTNIVNVAEITRYEDKDGNEIDKDVDSEPDNVDKKNEDDDDYEVIKIKTFDLSLLKYVSDVTVIEDGKETITETGNTGDPKTDIIPKVEIHRKKINSTVVKFGYKIKVTNEGDIAGYAKEITDYVPEGLKFYEEDNKGWVDEGNNVISTKVLENTLLQPGESAEVYVVFRWINGATNLGLKTNIAEISEDYNKEGIPDRDSTPDNKKPGEDDIDDAQVLLSISTGLVSNIIRYVSAGTVILVVFGIGIFAIKKYVL